MSTHSVMKMACGCVLALSAWAAGAQEAVPSLIVRADDMGSFRSANIACMEAFEKGIEHQMASADLMSESGGQERLFLPYDERESQLSGTGDQGEQVEYRRGGAGVQGTD